MKNKYELITRNEDEELLDAVARAITSPYQAKHFEDAPTTDFHRLDISDVMSVAVTEDIPLSKLLTRVNNVRGLNHMWFEQEHPRNPSVTFLSETADPSGGLAIVPKKYTNYMGKLGVEFSMTDLADIIARSGGLEAVGTDEMGRQLSAKFVELTRNQEVAILEAVESSTDPYGFRGLLGAYKSGTRNGWIGAAGVGVESRTSYDVGGTELTAANCEATLNKALLQIYELRAGPKPTHMFVPPRALNVIRAAASTKVQITMTQDELARMSALNLGGKVGMFYSDFGFLEIYAHPDLIVANATPGTGQNIPANSRFLLLYPRGIRVCDFAANPGVTIEPRAKTGPTEKRIISEWITLEVRNLPSQGEIRNFWIAP